MKANLRYLWQHTSRWLRSFIVISFSLTYLVLAFYVGPLAAAAAVIGGTAMMLGIMAIAFLEWNNILFFLLAIGLADLIANFLHQVGVSSDWAGIAAWCVAGWGYILYSLSAYKPSS